MVFMQMKIWLLAYSLPDPMLFCQPHHVPLEAVKIHGDSKVKAKEISNRVPYKSVEKKYYMDEFVLICCFKPSLFVSFCFVVPAPFIPYSIALLNFYTSLQLHHMFHWLCLSN